MILLKYLTKEIFKSQIAILFILLLIFFAQQLVRVLGSAVNGSVPSDLVFSLLGLGMPTMAQLMLPLCLFIAILMTLGRLYADSEITVMRACGVGQRILMRVALLLSLFTAALAAYNAFWLSPWAIEKQVNMLEQAKANPTLSALSPGQFISNNDGNFVLFIDDVEANRLDNIYLFQMRERGNIKPSVLVAENGNLEALPNGDQILKLNNSERYEGSAILPDFKITHFDDYQAYLTFANVTSESDKIERLNLNQLLNDGSDAAQAELWWRISLVLAVPLMALLAVPLSKVNPRQGRFAKMLPALLLYLIYFLLLSSLKSAGSGGKADATILIPLVHLVFFLIAIILNSWNSAFMYKVRHFVSPNSALED
ncbi:LPS export ABC transporter permease LptF [Testudinibacter aquarius]|uniref:Lipopolysaccharide export system permease protein LptF n=1 Tax=Testudinibacter aquarius TaxID=1524974 RepID=A0A4R3Y6W9_9PAST|nr:LPS export ABC transporter permease LptF [Testudinibacter aquarius]TNG92210.1 LPS export ABC transporter permease LptF [Pasteurellaceae bacterium UScroc12]TNG96221.1 LPS export ABC transporter permease LptF [Pasteurellaceae bacterium USgator41]TNH01614.1 LPS export ABC transporter permease LptF [Pasteurellaceae bacterium UScroc31]TNH02948.1 LPS export ABC transporter permease LptF [Pasteurellaceae bacterium USgator11]KAE9526030.1 lipopolysaccharide ABC transporter permease LptF [Testudiniba